MLRVVLRSGGNAASKWQQQLAAMSSAALPAPVTKPDITHTGASALKFIYANQCKIRILQIKSNCLIFAFDLLSKNARISAHCRY
jgi:hypothetical protein